MITTIFSKALCMTRAKSSLVKAGSTNDPTQLINSLINKESWASLCQVMDESWASHWRVMGKALSSLG